MGLQSAGVPVLVGALLLIEAGAPLPVPGDVLMLLLGERASAHAIPLWAAGVALELVTLVGVGALFLAARGPARALIERLAHRIDLRGRVPGPSGGQEHAAGRCSHWGGPHRGCARSP